MTEKDSLLNKAASSTVIKALRILDSLLILSADRPEGVSVSELARHSGEHASSVCKHLAAFQQFQLVDQHPHTDKYVIGTYSMRLAAAAMKHIDLRRAASRHLHELMEASGETVHLVIRDGKRVVYIEKVETSKPIRMHSNLGTRNPLYCTGVGKAILAFSSPSLIEAVIDEGLVRFTEHTLTTSSELLQDLDTIRRRGYALDLGEHEPEVHCAAAPIFNHLGEVVAAISVAGPKWRLPQEKLDRAGQLVMRAANQISNQIGGARD
ncbi:IclR family transcriptional regulator [Paenibacillus sp. J2TS4]|uniref:IclR family transcriptional regulator n=1 Tax=Paenibacillus sp. J2TS4 TaxID=2807194 RepID=UPI001B1DBF07|nr:IclR family transcriptional regulator [Paenibacillus sp. J2TS4]GIP31936.1 IclR family transcriptional regulator [Paenibacillus sp. J2TS4]